MSIWLATGGRLQEINIWWSRHVRYLCVVYTSIYDQWVWVMNDGVNRGTYFSVLIKWHINRVDINIHFSILVCLFCLKRRSRELVKEERKMGGCQGDIHTVKSMLENCINLIECTLILSVIMITIIVPHTITISMVDQTIFNGFSPSIER